MATNSIIATALSLLLLTLASAQQLPGSYDKSAEKAWNNFVNEAAKATGGTPIRMVQFVTRANNNLNGGDAEESDRKLIEAKFNGLEPHESEAKVDELKMAMANVIRARKTATANGRSFIGSIN